MDQRLPDPAVAAPPNWRGLCEELADKLATCWPSTFDAPDCLTRARAALAAEPAPPAEWEVAELVEWLRDDLELYPAEKRRAADLLEQRHPTPVSVNERLPGPEDCDGEGRCWFLRFPFDYSRESWSLEDRTYGCNTGFTHWLPATALPLPQGEVE